MRTIELLQKQSLLILFITSIVIFFYTLTHFRNVGSPNVSFSNNIDFKMFFLQKVAAPSDSLLLPLQYYFFLRKLPTLRII